MKTPSEFQLSQLAHVYDPIKAHEYYMRVRQLKGRKPGQQPPPTGTQPGGKAPPPHLKPKGSQKTREQQKQELANNIKDLTTKLQRLESLIQNKEAVLARDQLQAKSRANQNAKGKGNAPKTAAQKAKAKQASQQYHQRHKAQQKAQQKSKGAGSGGGGGKGGSAKAAKPINQQSIAQLKALATKVRGQIAVAKQKLAAL